MIDSNGVMLITPKEYISKNTVIIVSAIGIIAYIILNSIREAVQIYQQKIHYILEVVNIISWILHISALMMVLPVFSANNEVTTIHYSAASITVFLSWFKLLLFLQRFDQVITGNLTYLIDAVILTYKIKKIFWLKMTFYLLVRAYFAT